MPDFDTLRLADAPMVKAPDGGDVRILLALAGGSMATFELDPGLTSKPVTHRTVEEVWYCIAGEGEIWRKSDATEEEETVALRPGIAISLPLGTRFQFRAIGPAPLEVIITTLPPWPGEGEAFDVEGAWEPTR